MRLQTLLLWLPRLIGLAAAAFLSLFALDAFSEPGSVWARISSFAVHLMPAAIVLLAVGVAWRNPLAGGLLFIGLGIAYALTVDASRHPDWIAVVAGPLWLTGALFLIGYMFRAGRGSSAARR
jgi:hypothetical protein